MSLATRIIAGLAPNQTRQERCIRKFLRFFPRGFHDPKYYAWERGYKIEAHEKLAGQLNKRAFRQLIEERRFTEIGSIVTRIESRTNLLFSFEKMAFRDAVRDVAGSEIFARAFYDLLYARGHEKPKFEAWCNAISDLPRKQTRVLTHPVVTVWPFLAQSDRHIFLKPMVTKAAAAEYGFDFVYKSKPSWEVYSSLLRFAETLREDLKRLAPRDMIDIQSFIWVLGSSEYR
ncbi:MAG: hypothetical protein JO053_06040 [Acidobacteria bacterium]|nr:hypothetical protein [Acidobacteriota bacterium]